MAKQITSLSDLTPDPSNANAGTERGRYMVESSLRETGAGRSIVVDADGRIIAGNKTLEAWADIGGEIEVVKTDGTKLIVVQRDDLDLADVEGRARRLAYLDNRAGEVGLQWDAEQILADINAGVDLDSMFFEDEIEELLSDILPPPEPIEDAGPQIDRAEELRQKWGVELGQLWQLGEHRVICGDCTDAATVKRVMQEDRADMCHADPPYGMSKEKDGIANDNLYGKKLDAFQMSWWTSARPHLKDNGSAYIWGNAESLWRLWYIGGLKESERLTLRNEIVWDKNNVQGMKVDGLRMYPNASERCLFFMLGEQGFDSKTDNYWEGWEPVRGYLAAQVEAMGWTPADVKRIAGVGMFSHWFTKSQWSMITRERYEALQKAARNDAFKREYDDLRREYDDLRRDFYATWVYFDNAHDEMTDVWQFQRVTGGSRHEHATPKPVKMMGRAIKSSCPKDGIVFVPFNGTGPELIACEQLSRKCRSVEIDPGYVAVTLERWHEATGKTPVLLTD